MNTHTIKCLVEIERLEARLGRSKILHVIHAVVALILVPVQVRDCPFDLEAERLLPLVVLMLLHLLRDVHALNVVLETRQPVAQVKGTHQLIRLAPYGVRLRLVQV